jgi:hypothetical protein
MEARKEVICQACGYRGPARKIGCGQVALLIVLACLTLFPGLIYAVYLHFWLKGCPNCDQKRLIPADSPNAIGR